MKKEKKKEVVVLEKNRVGRPTIYTKEFIEAEADEFFGWAKNFPKNKPLFYKAFALDRGYSPQRYSEWANVNKKFSEALESVKQFQERNWVENAMLGNYNAVFTKFCMGHHYKYREQDSLSDNRPTEVTVLVHPDRVSKDD